MGDGWHGLATLKPWMRRVRDSLIFFVVVTFYSLTLHSTAITATVDILTIISYVFILLPYFLMMSLLLSTECQ